jgi:SAM-dependent methyltransferase
VVRLRSLIVKDLVGDIGGCRILDLGCGDGSISAQFLPGKNRVTLVDRSAGMLERAKRNVPDEHASQVEFVHGDIVDLTPRAPYDLVLCIGVLAHVDSVERIIEKVANLVKPDGRAVFQISDDSQPLVRLGNWVSAASSVAGRSSLSYKRMTLRDVIFIAARHRLALLRHRRHLLLLPGMARLLGRWLIPYDLFISDTRSLAKHGCDAIFICRKEG